MNDPAPSSTHALTPCPAPSVPWRTVLLTREFLLGALVVALATGVCIGLGLWQYGRFEAKRDQAQAIEAQQGLPAAPLDEILPTADAALPSSLQWRAVQLHGRYCTSEDCVLYVRNRTLGGRTGFWQLVPLRTETGRSLLVVRGWVDMAATTSEPADPPPVPDGPVTVTAQLRPAEAPLRDRSNPPGQVQTVTPSAVSALFGAQAPQLQENAYGVMRSEDPTSAAPLPLEKPDTSLGPHLSYAFQWWIFALFFPVGLWSITRRRRAELLEDRQRGTAQDASAHTAPTQSAHHPDRRRTSRARRRTLDEEEEDALIDRHQP